MVHHDGRKEFGFDLFTHPQARDSDNHFVVIRGFLDAAEIAKIHKARSHWSVREIKDRKYSLDYDHVAHRLEFLVKYKFPELYNKLIEAVEVLS